MAADLSFGNGGQTEREIWDIPSGYNFNKSAVSSASSNNHGRPVLSIVQWKRSAFSVPSPETSMATDKQREMAKKQHSFKLSPATAQSKQICQFLYHNFARRRLRENIMKLRACYLRVVPVLEFVPFSRTPSTNGNAIWKSYRLRRWQMVSSCSF